RLRTGTRNTVGLRRISMACGPRREIMSILLIGLNHRTAPFEIREQLAFGREGVATALLLFRNQFPGSEAAILSTCNRVEMLVASDGEKPTAADGINFIA